MPKPDQAELLEGSRELLELDVREVSLVDRPANKREFLVIKRLEGNNMTTPTNLDGEVKDEAAAEVVASVDEKEPEQEAVVEKAEEVQVDASEVSAPELLAAEDDGDAEAIAKARRMTPARLKKLRESLTILDGLLKDLDPELVGEVTKADDADQSEDQTIEAVVKAVVAEAVAPLVAIVAEFQKSEKASNEAEQVEQAEAKKQNEEQEAAQATDMEGVMKRLAALEGVPTAGAQNDSNTEVIKSNSLWQGVI